MFNENHHSNSDVNYASVQWYGIQTVFEQADSDVLFLLDCCAGAGGAPAEGCTLSVRETISACGFETWAPQPGRHSFTNTLIKVLNSWRTRPAFTAAMLHCEVLNRLRHEKPERYGTRENFECRRTPIHIVSTRDYNAKSVEIRPRKSSNVISDNVTAYSPDRGQNRGSTSSKVATSQSQAEFGVSPPSNSTQQDDIYESNSLTSVLENGDTVIPQVLVSLSLEGEQLLDVEQWRKWLQDFPALAKFAKIEGMYKSNSTLLILSIPVVVWDWIPDDPACGFIGYMYSQNQVICKEEPIAETSSGEDPIELGLAPDVRDYFVTPDLVHECKLSFKYQYRTN
jgi:hypothetical protein